MLDALSAQVEHMLERIVNHIGSHHIRSSKTIGGNRGVYAIRDASLSSVTGVFYLKYLLSRS